MEIAYTDRYAENNAAKYIPNRKQLENAKLVKHNRKVYPKGHLAQFTECHSEVIWLIERVLD